ncbi:MAG: glycosyltransferase family 61 protein [Pelatocladus maniniholoensis HA4357-MV3]|jgi:capsular polysaccharide biosynthesis protein|uniref:Glycosyltransferase family 61 protein n=1 Tax=Pelatocladus maniniholoensis HA4357-MV3 TaxID=1117104 RepID=A0A9E3H9T7_9NOST|nr:glycosyltransferase family 61 protein [Pelatocladus maniniholoensis HA4357-MV3]BAZ69121.1 capsular polysaccharide biosynthesis protein-like protein [Fischerella sp. NIES-4106]
MKNRNNFQRNYIIDTVSTLRSQLKYQLKVNLLSQPFARGVIQLCIDNVDRYFGNDKEIKIYKLVNQEKISIQEAKFIEGDFLRVITPFQDEIEAVVIDTSKNGFCFCNNHIFDENLNVIYEKDIHFYELPIYGCELSANFTKLQGTVAYLSNATPKNYGHWFIYTLPMLEVYWRFIDKQEIDYYYVGEITNFKIETLAALGINKEKIVDFPCKADRAITCVINRKVQNGGHQYPTSLAYWLARNIFLPKKNYSNNKYPKRLYVKRGQVDHREVINDHEVIEYLESIGFEALTMDGRTTKEEAEIFYSADVIISVCGSALTNLLFIREGITVIEIFPFGYLDGHFYALANYSQANYFYIIGEKIAHNSTIPHLSNLKVNINKLKKICKLANLV